MAAETNTGIVQTILYVHDQEVSKRFYEKILNRKADLHVPGMTEFHLNPYCRIGLMPNSGIAKILKDKTPDPASGTGIPRCELYLYVENPEMKFNEAVSAGAKIISEVCERDWGHNAGYVCDPDGHIIAFATEIG